MAVEDRTLTCRDCGTRFAFTVGEQAFYSERGFVAPVRCPDCRARRRAANAGARPGAVPEQAAPRPERKLYQAVCAECGREAWVPFEPRFGRPVYCRDCFQRMRPDALG